MREGLAGKAMWNGLGTLAALSLIGWGLILWSVANMSSPVVALMMPMTAAWTLLETLAVLLMWAVMMGAMMLPSAGPGVQVHRRLAADYTPAQPGAGHWFLTGYLLAWTGFSLAATALHWGFLRADILSPMGKLQDAFVAGGVLLVAGVFQLTPPKIAFLAHCRRPDAGNQAGGGAGGRSGRLGALRMGFDQGLCCIGCCWALMLVLFVGGVMSLTTIVVLTLAVAVEKLAPKGAVLARLGGVLLIGFGSWVMAAAAGAAPAVPWL